MKLIYTSFILIALVFTVTIVKAQEKIDSIELDKKIVNSRITIPEYKMTMVGKPDFFPEIKKFGEDYNLKDKSWDRFILEEGLRKFPDGSTYLTYTSPNNAIHYFNASDPVYLDFDFHLKPLTNWNKLDMYLFGNGLLVNQYLPDEENHLTQSGRGFLWDTGVGIEYNFSDKASLFYEFSARFKNQSYNSTYHKTGLRCRF